MSTAEELKEAGFVEYGKLVELVADATRMSEQTTYEWLSGRLMKLKPFLAQTGEMILPDDRSLQCLYSIELVPLLAAFMNWHGFNTKRSIIQVVRFYEDYKKGSRSAMKHVPRRLRSIGSLATQSNVQLVAVS